MSARSALREQVQHAVRLPIFQKSIRGIVPVNSLTPDAHYLCCQRVPSHLLSFPAAFIQKKREMSKKHKNRSCLMNTHTSCRTWEAREGSFLSEEEKRKNMQRICCLPHNIAMRISFSSVNEIRLTFRFTALGLAFCVSPFIIHP